MRWAGVTICLLAGCAEASSAQQARPGLVPEGSPAPPAAAAPEPPAPQKPRWPAVDLAPQAGDHVYSKVRHLWIRQQPNRKAWIGYLSLGDAVRVKGGDATRAYVAPGSGGCEAWYAVEPTGVVCVGENATLDPDDPLIVELRKHAAERRSPWPFDYAESHGVQLLPLFDRLALPPGGITPQTSVARGSTLAFTDTVEHAGERFLRTWDGALVPASAATPYPASHFEGVVLGPQVSLPIAFFRGADGRAYRRGEEMVATEVTYPRLSWLALSGETAVVGGAHYHRVKDADVWVADDEVTVARRSEDIPLVVQRDGDGRKTWLDVSIEGGTLVAYEGTQPVYATLISPGRGGMPLPGVPTLDSASTPVGLFAVLGKFLTATMQSGSIATLIHAEVQYTMNFMGPYALHGAYWHDRWGEKKSGGCVNLSPIDSQRIFEWSEPRLPLGWHGMRTMIDGDGFGWATRIYLHR